MTKEQIYDEQIAPLMTQIIEVCRANQIGMHASFLLDGDMAVTTNLNPENTAVLRLMRYLSKAGDNFDAFAIAAARDGKQHGHSSMALHLLGAKVDEGKL